MKKMKSKIKNRRDSLPLKELAKALKKSKARARSVSPSGSKTTPLKVMMNRVDMSDSGSFLRKSGVKTTPTKAQQKQFEPSVLKKFEKLQKMKIKQCKVLIKRQNLKKLQNSFVESTSGETKEHSKSSKNKRKVEDEVQERSPSPKKSKSSLKSSNEKSKTNFFIKLGSSSLKKSNLKVSDSPLRKEVGEWPGASPRKLSVTPTKFSRSQLIEQFGKRFFSSVVKVEHCPHPLMVAFEAEARKQRSKRKLSKNLSVSFHQEVEIFDQSSTSYSTISKISQKSATAGGSGLITTPMPQRLQKIENGKVVIDTELDESFFLANNLEAIQAASTPLINNKKGKKVNRGKTNLNHDLLPILGVNLLKDQDDDDEAEFIVPEVDIPDKHKIVASTSSGISVASITKAASLNDSENIFTKPKPAKQSSLPKLKKPKDVAEKPSTELKKSPQKKTHKYKGEKKMICEDSNNEEKTERRNNKNLRKKELKDKKKKEKKISLEKNLNKKGKTEHEEKCRNSEENSEVTTSENDTNLLNSPNKDESKENLNENKEVSSVSKSEIVREPTSHEEPKDHSTLPTQNECLANDSQDDSCMEQNSLAENSTNDKLNETMLESSIEEYNKSENGINDSQNGIKEKELDINTTVEEKKQEEDAIETKETSINLCDNSNSSDDSFSSAIESIPDTSDVSLKKNPPETVTISEDSNDDVVEINVENRNQNSLNEKDVINLDDTEDEEKSQDQKIEASNSQDKPDDSNTFTSSRNVDDDVSFTTTHNTNDLSTNNCVDMEPLTVEEGFFKNSQESATNVDEPNDNASDTTPAEVKKSCDEQKIACTSSGGNLEEQGNDKIFDLDPNLVDDLETVATNFSSDSTSETTNNVDNIISELTKDIESNYINVEKSCNSTQATDFTAATLADKFSDNTVSSSRSCNVENIDY